MDARDNETTILPVLTRTEVRMPPAPELEVPGVRDL